MTPGNIPEGEIRSKFLPASLRLQMALNGLNIALARHRLCYANVLSGHKIAFT